MPVVQRQADAPAPTGPAARDEHPPTGPAAGPSVRPTLGGQPSAAPPAGEAGTPAGPVVQRLTDAPAPGTTSAAPPAAGDTPLPVIQRQTDEPGGPPPPAPDRAGHAQRPPAARPTLGKPLRELPAAAAPFAPPTRDAGGPALPVVQRQTADSADPAHPAPSTGPGSHARTRGGLGAPLSALPPTAGTASDAARQARAATPQPGAPRPPQSGAPAMPLRTAPPVQRTPDAPVRVRPVPSRRASRPAPVQRARALLVARTLTVRTGAAEGFTARASATASRPVVPATWRRDTPRAEAGREAEPAPGAPAPGTPVVQRVAADPVAPPRPHAPLPARAAAPQEPPVPAGFEAEPAPRAPVVRPHPPGTPRPGGPAAPVQRLAMPVVAETGGPVAGPEPEGGAPSVPQSLAVRPTRPAPQAPHARANAQAVQRAVAEAGLAGVPVTVVQRKPAPAPAPERPAEPAADVDVEDLARRLIDPVARLLRADLRRGRERSGRPYDGRR
ncbi:hypothetical protein AB0891_12365 [Streptomyces sp. NPDC007259]|uniref:hypothetical protein n=1 Tax=Streptomyces sp. NPDC007259 TaxID=3154319 RepID=UPI003454A97A